MKTTKDHLVEYKCIPAYAEPAENTDRLNRLAREGWRLDGVLAANRPNGSGQFVLVRRVDNG